MGILDPVCKTTDLLEEVLPVGDLVNEETIRNHLQLTAERIEQELGEERQLNQLEGSEQEWEEQPLPDGQAMEGEASPVQHLGKRLCNAGGSGRVRF